jgi:hypothetical protein
MGFVYVTQLRKGRDLGTPVQRVGIWFENFFSKKNKVHVSYRKKSTGPSFGSTFSKSTKEVASSGDATQEEIDRILDKIAEKGYDALNKEEKRKLFEFSKK